MLDVCGLMRVGRRGPPWDRAAGAVLLRFVCRSIATTALRSQPCATLNLNSLRVLRLYT